MPKTTMTSKGRITVPKEVREHLGVGPGDRLDFQIRDGGAVVVEADTIDLSSLRGALKRRGPRVSLAEMGRAIRRAAAGR